MIFGSPNHVYFHSCQQKLNPTETCKQAEHDRAQGQQVSFRLLVRLCKRPAANEDTVFSVHPMHYHVLQ